MMMLLATRLNQICKSVNPQLRQKLLTVEVLNQLPPLYSQDGHAEPTAYLKLFGSGRWTWFMTEACAVVNMRELPLTEVPIEDIGNVMDVNFFGYVISGLGEDCDEFSYFTLRELAQQLFPPFNLPIERDMHFQPKALSEAVKPWKTQAAV